MLSFREFYKTQSDQNIHKNAPNCTTFLKLSQGSRQLAYAPELPSICVQLYLICIFT